jgi:hypothetical protein
MSNMAALPNMNALLDVLYAALEVQIHARRENHSWPLRDWGKIVAGMMEDWSTQPYAFHETANYLINGSRELFDEADNFINHRHSETVRAYVRLLSVQDKARNG